jgi:hypothetical protein
MIIKLTSSARVPKLTSLLEFDVDFFCAEWQQRKSFCFVEKGFGKVYEQALDTGHWYIRWYSTSAVFPASSKQFGTHSEGDERMNSSFGKR